MWNSLSKAEQEEQEQREDEALEKVQHLERKIKVVQKKIRKAKNLKMYCDEQQAIHITTSKAFRCTPSQSAHGPFRRCFPNAQVRLTPDKR